MAQPAQTLVKVPVPKVPANDVGRVVQEAIDLSHAVKAVATKNASGTWDLMITRPSGGGSGPHANIKATVESKVNAPGAQRVTANKNPGSNPETWTIV